MPNGNIRDCFSFTGGSLSADCRNFFMTLLEWQIMRKLRLIPASPVPPLPIPGPDPSPWRGSSFEAMDPRLQATVELQQQLLGELLLDAIFHSKREGVQSHFPSMVQTIRKENLHVQAMESLLNRMEKAVSILQEEIKQQTGQ